MEKLTRRARGPGNDSGLDSAEAGHHYAPDRIHSSVDLAEKSRRRRRKKSSLFMKKLKKRIELFLRRSALSRTALISSVAGVFLVAIVTTLGVGTMFYSRLESVPIKESIKEKLHPPDFLAPATSRLLHPKRPDSLPLTKAEDFPVAKEKGVPRSVVVVPPPSFDIVLPKRTLLDGFDSVAFPPELSAKYEAEGEFVDLGGLEMLFFVEDGDKRNIIYDHELFETDFRDPGKKRDDDGDDG
jgi:hypothetical protein